MKHYCNINYINGIKIINVNDDSMKPTYNDKDLILVDTSYINFKNRAWVSVDNDKLFIKRLKKIQKRIIAIVRMIYTPIIRKLLYRMKTKNLIYP